MKTSTSMLMMMLAGLAVMTRAHEHDVRDAAIHARQHHRDFKVAGDAHAMHRGLEKRHRSRKGHPSKVSAYAEFPDGLLADVVGRLACWCRRSRCPYACCRRARRRRHPRQVELREYRGH